jgi:hypothetical protein
VRRAGEAEEGARARHGPRGARRRPAHKSTNAPPPRAHLHPAVALGHDQSQVGGLDEVDVVGVRRNAGAGGLLGKKHLERGGWVGAGLGEAGKRRVRGC